MSGIVGTSHSKSKEIGKSHDTAKAWVYYKSSDVTIRESFNISSLDDRGTGISTANFIQPFETDKFVGCVSATHGGASAANRCGSSQAHRTSTAWLNIWQGTTANLADADYVSAAFFGK